MGEYDSEEGKKSNEEKVLLMTHLGDLIICEGATVASAKRRGALCFVRFILEQISVLALNTCEETLSEGIELAKTLLSDALLELHESKPLRLNMKEAVKLEHLRKINKIRKNQ